MKNALVCYFLFTVNSTHELGPLIDLKIPANKTRWTLKNLNFSTRYKFYFYAQTSVGPGSQITEEGVTTVDEGKMGMYEILHGLVYFLFPSYQGVSILPTQTLICNSSFYVYLLLYI